MQKKIVRGKPRNTAMFTVGFLPDCMISNEGKKMVSTASLCLDQLKLICGTILFSHYFLLSILAIVDIKFKGESTHV